MIYIAMSLIVFLIVVVIHTLIVRQSKQKSTSVGLFLFLSSMGLMVMWILFDSIFFFHSPQFLKSTATLIYLLLMPLYAMYYRSISHTNPARKILQVIETRSKASYEELLSAVEEQKYIEQALTVMVRNGQARKKDGRYSLTARGKFLAFFANLDQSFFKRSTGGRP